MKLKLFFVLYSNDVGEVGVDGFVCRLCGEIEMIGYGYYIVVVKELFWFELMDVYGV